MTYDASGNVVESKDAGASYEGSRVLTTKYEYDPVGNLKRLISPRASDASADKLAFNQYVTPARL